MAVEVTMPKLGLTMSEGLLARWLVADGEHVTKGQPIFEIETDKASVEAEAAVDGVLSVAVEAGSVIPVMGVVGYILAPGEKMPETGLSALEGELTGAGVVEQAGTRRVEGQPSRPSASPAARRRAQELEVDISQIRGTGEGGRVTIADVEAFAAVAQRAVDAPQETEDWPAGHELRASPLAKRMAREAGIDLAAVQGTGPGGRITRQDVELALGEPEHAGIDFVSAPGAGISPASNEGPPEGELVALGGVRAIIAERMLASAQGTAAVTLTTTVDATELIARRDRFNEGPDEELSVRVSYNDILIKILAVALKEFPYMNAHQGEGGVRLLPYVHIGLAVDTERGLLVIVVRDVDQKSIPEISRETSDKAQQAMAGTITPDELSGGTFTLTNLGAFGVEAYTPIINPPEAAVLGVGRIQPAPMVYRGEIALRQSMALSLTFDHRLIDGAPAARFLARVRELIEKPHLMLGE